MEQYSTQLILKEQTELKPGPLHTCIPQISPVWKTQATTKKALPFDASLSSSVEQEAQAISPMIMT